MKKFKMANAMALCVLFMFSFLVFYSCEEIVGEDDVVSNPPPPPEGDHDTIDTSATVVEFLSPAAIPINSCMSVVSGVLTFTDDDCFRDVYNSILNHNHVSLNNWEASYGFSSLWTFYDLAEADPNYDDLASDDGRNADEYFERLLNSDHKMTIAGLTYQFDYAASTVTIIDAINNTVVVESIDPVTANKRGWTCAGSKNKVEKGTFDSGNRKIRISKHRRNKFGAGAGKDYSSIYMKMCNYKKNSLGFWKKEKNKMTAFIDRWHELKLERTQYTSGGVTSSGINLSDLILSDKKWVVNDQKSVTWYIHSSRSSSSYLNYNQACAEKWERMHAYTDNNFNDDIHHDVW